MCKISRRNSKPLLRKLQNIYRVLFTAPCISYSVAITTEATHENNCKLGPRVIIIACGNLRYRHSVAGNLINNS